MCMRIRARPVGKPLRLTATTTNKCCRRSSWRHGQGRGKKLPTGFRFPQDGLNACFRGFVQHNGQSHSCQQKNLNLSRRWRPGIGNESRARLLVDFPPVLSPMAFQRNDYQAHKFSKELISNPLDHSSIASHLPNGIYFISILNYYKCL